MNQLIIIEHKGERVLTTKQLSESYGTEAGNIQRNVNRNQDRFKEGVHYFKLEGEELSKFKASDDISFSPVVGNRVNTLFLWTEKGCLNHAKLLETDQAWQVFEMLVDTYFRVKQFKEFQNTRANREFTKVDVSLKIAESIFRELRLPDSGKITVYSKICDEYEVGKEMLPAYVDEKVTKSMTELLKQFGAEISAVKANRILLEEGILEEKTRPSKKSGTKTFYSLTEKGLEFGKNLICPANALETQPHYYEDKFGELLAIIEKKSI